MEKHLLITVGDDLTALYGARFAASFFTNKELVRITLLYVAPAQDSGAPKVKAHAHRQEATEGSFTGDGSSRVMEESKKLLLFRGFKDESIDTKLVNKRFGTAKDIVLEGRRGLYDAVILGRRGFALFEKALSSSVSREMLEQEIDFPIWICSRPEEGRKHVLLCLDDSVPSLRIADHVGFILQHEEHCITLFHADEGEGKNVDRILAQARQALRDNGVAEERIRQVVVRSSRVASAILDEAEKGGYAAVAVGRGGGKEKGMLRKLLYGGSRSMKLLDALERSSLWVSK